ncbi:MAG TPA: hypothetical protein VF605_18075 [Allosphingosinicella sp.]
MIIRPSLPSGYLHICDDVRQEFNGKFTFVGIYYGEMIFAGVNHGVVPQLSIVVTYQFAPGDLPNRMRTRAVFLGDSGRETLLIEDEAELPQSPPPTTFPIQPDEVPVLEWRRFLRIGTTMFPEPGRIRVRGYFGDAELRLGSLRVTIVPPAPSPT